MTVLVCRADNGSECSLFCMLSDPHNYKTGRNSSCYRLKDLHLASVLVGYMDWDVEVDTVTIGTVLWQ